MLCELVFFLTHGFFLRQGPFWLTGIELISFDDFLSHLTARLCHFLNYAAHEAQASYTLGLQGSLCVRNRFGKHNVASILWLVNNSCANDIVSVGHGPWDILVLVND